MLAPNQRVTIYDVLKPPVGWSFDALLACTYSASLDTILSLPAAVHGEARGGPEAAYGAADLAALKRICGATLIFCQRGAIHPAALLTPAIVEAEPMIWEVDLPRTGARPPGAFHPKLWLVRFKQEGKARSMLRLAVASRNLTADASWDIGVVLESGLKPAPREENELSTFIQALPGLTCRRLSPVQRRMVDSLADQAECARWQAPEGLRKIRFHALGIGGRAWRQPRCDRMILLSPFLTSRALDRLTQPCGGPIAVVSRPEALDRTWEAASRCFPSRRILAPPADPELPQAVGRLHGKALFWDEAGRCHAAVGSMNATTPAVGGTNVEFMVSFDCSAALGDEGLDALLLPSGLGAVLEEYEPDDPTAVLPEPFDDRPARAALCSLGLWIDCEPCGEAWRLSLRCEVALAAVPEPLRGLCFRPVTLPAAAGAPCLDGLLGPQRRADYPAPLELAQVTGFVVFEAGAGDNRVAFTLNLEVRGVPEEERRLAALRALLPTERSFVDFVRILLGDFSALGGGSGGAPGSQSSSSAGRSGFGPGLLELLVRCGADEPERLRQIGATLDALSPDEFAGVAPKAFRDLWTALANAPGLLR